MPLTISEQTKKAGQNHGGLVEAFFCLRKEVDLTQWPALATEAGIDTLAKIEADVVFTTGGRWYKFYVTPETAAQMSELAGERDGKSFANKVDGFFPGDKAMQRGFFKLLSYEDVYLAVRNAEGEMILVGDEYNACHLDTGNGTTGAARADRRGITLSFVHNGDIAVIYEGAISETPAV